LIDSVALHRHYKSLAKAKTRMIVVAWTTPFGFLNAIASSVVWSKDSTPGTLFVIYVLLLWAIGISLWVWVYVGYSQIHNANDAKEIKSFEVAFFPYLNALDQWLVNFNSLNSRLVEVSTQLHDASSDWGIFRCSFQNGLRIYTFEIYINDEFLGITSEASAGFIDNTSMQTYVTSTNTRGTIEPKFTNNSEYKINASTSSTVHHQRSGNAYVEISSPNFSTYVATFTNPNDASYCANQINALSGNYELNLQERPSVISDLELAVTEAQSKFDNFFSDSRDFRTEIRKFPKDLVGYYRSLSSDVIDAIKAD
jgi:hypothetical protein